MQVAQIPVQMSCHEVGKYLHAHGIKYINLLGDLQSVPKTNGVQDLGYCKLTTLHEIAVTDTDSGIKVQFKSLQAAHAHIIRNYIA